MGSQSLPDPSCSQYHTPSPKVKEKDPIQPADHDQEGAHGVIGLMLFSKLWDGGT